MWFENSNYNLGIAFSIQMFFISIKFLVHTSVTCDFPENLSFNKSILVTTVNYSFSVFVYFNTFTFLEHHFMNLNILLGSHIKISRWSKLGKFEKMFLKNHYRIVKVCQIYNTFVSKNFNKDFFQITYWRTFIYTEFSN